MEVCNLERGRAIFAQCAVCHGSIDSPSNATGPTLHAILGRPIGKIEGFKFSPALRKTRGEWSAARLDAFLENPMKSIPGSRMAFAGMPNPDDRAAVICFLEREG